MHHILFRTHMRPFATTLATLALAVAGTMPSAAISRQRPAKSATTVKAYQRGLQSISMEAAKAHVYFLADDLLEGRRAGQRGSRIAQQYIVAQMRQLGLQPLPGHDFLIPFEAYSRAQVHREGRYWVEADSVKSISQSPHHLKLSLANTLAWIPGKRTDEFVVVGAHLDHEGMNPDLNGDQIYNGADDNASGVSAALQIMRAFAVSGVKPERSVVFAFWDGEEFGLLGSRHFAETSTIMPQVKGYLNFDMVGGNNKPSDPQQFVYFFTESHPALGQWLKDDIARHKLALHPDYHPWDNPVGGSDQSTFAKKGVPIVWYHTDAQPHYNHPSDEAPTLNYDKLTDITRASFLTLWHMANEPAF